MKGCLEALGHVHIRRVIHRDIKVEDQLEIFLRVSTFLLDVFAAQGANILLNEQGVCKLADFGVSAQVANSFAQRLGQLCT